MKSLGFFWVVDETWSSLPLIVPNCVNIICLPWWGSESLLWLLCRKPHWPLHPTDTAAHTQTQPPSATAVVMCGGCVCVGPAAGSAVGVLWLQVKPCLVLPPSETHNHNAPRPHYYPGGPLATVTIKRHEWNLGNSSKESSHTHTHSDWIFQRVEQSKVFCK